MERPIVAVGGGRCCGRCRRPLTTPPDRRRSFVCELLRMTSVGGIDINVPGVEVCFRLVGACHKLTTRAVANRHWVTSSMFDHQWYPFTWGKPVGKCWAA